MKKWGAKGEPEGKNSQDEEAGEPSRRKNRLFFYSEVNQETIQSFVTHLREAEHDARKLAVEMDTDPPTIHVHIHSYGGDVFAGVAAMDAILEIRERVPVHTHIEGGAASAATMMSVAGTHRTIGAHSFILIHQLSSEFWGKFEEWKDEMKNNESVMAMINAFYAEHANMQARQVKQILKKDLWFDAKRALRLGLVDEIR